MSIGLLNDGDYAEWSEIWRQYLEFYKTTLPEEQYKNTWSRILAPDGDLHAFVLRDDQEKIIGLSHYLFHTQTWTDKPDCYLNDLFVDKAVRGKGYGRKLIMATHQAAKDKGCGRLYWATQESNATARKLYDSVGQLEFVQYKMAIEISNAVE